MAILGVARAFYCWLGWSLRYDCSMTLIYSDPFSGFHLGHAHRASFSGLSSQANQPQIHNPRLSTNTSTSASASAEAEADLDSSAWDGAAEMVFPSATESSSSAGAAMSDPYYQHVILADERRFLVSEALMHLKVVPPGTVVGERRVVIRDGKAVVAEGEGKGKEEEEDEAAKRAWVVWREWEAGRGVVQ